MKQIKVAAYIILYLEALATREIRNELCNKMENLLKDSQLERACSLAQ